MQTEGAVDRAVLQIAFGPETARRSWVRTVQLREEAKAAGCRPIDLMQDSAGGPLHFDDERIGRMLTGDTRTRPDHERLRAGADLLARAVAHCPHPARSWALCALGWVRWAMGLTNSAIELVSSAERIDSYNTLAPYYLALVMRCTPNWIFEEPASTSRSARRNVARRR